MTTAKEALKSLDTWHNAEIRGHKVYYADAVRIALEKVSQSDGKLGVKDV